MAPNWQGGTAPTAGEEVGTLTFPRLTSADCELEEPADACYVSFDNLAGVSAEALALDDGDDYLLFGEGITIGEGGLTATPASGSSGEAGDVLEVPIHLSASQEWHIAGHLGGVLGENGLLLASPISGSGDELTLDLHNEPLLFLAETDTEVGPVKIEGPNTSAGAINGVVVLLDGAVNSTDKQPVHLSHILFEGSGALGPLTTSDTAFEVGTPVEGVEVTSAKLDPASDAVFNIAFPGATASSDYSQLKSHGAIELAGSQIEVVVRKPSEGESCPTLLPGQTFTFVSTTGSLTGAFSNAPSGGPEIPITFGPGCPKKTQTMRIAYHETGSPQTVTAVVEEAAKQAQEEAEAAEKREQEEAAATKRHEEEAAATKRREEEAAMTKRHEEEAAAQRTREEEARAAANQRKKHEEEEFAALLKRGEGAGGGSVLGTTESNVTSAQIVALLRQALIPGGKAAKSASVLKAGGYTLTFKAPEAGGLVLSWYLVPHGAKLATAKPTLVASAQASFSSAGTKKVKLKLTSAGKHLLKRSKSTKLTGRGSFAATGEVSRDHDRGVRARALGHRAGPAARKPPRGRSGCLQTPHSPPGHVRELEEHRDRAELQGDRFERDHQLRVRRGRPSATATRASRSSRRRR